MNRGHAQLSLMFSFGLLLAACANPDVIEDDRRKHRGWWRHRGRGRSGGRGWTRRQHRRGRHRRSGGRRRSGRCGRSGGRGWTRRQRRHGRRRWSRGRGRSGRRGWTRRQRRRRRGGRGRTWRQRGHRRGGRGGTRWQRGHRHGRHRYGGYRRGGHRLGRAPAACAFANGLNAAWVNFANDVPNPNMTAFQTMFRNTQMAGGRIVRWWFHTNGTVTPGYNGSGMANPLSQAGDHRPDQPAQPGQHQRREAGDQLVVVRHVAGRPEHLDHAAQQQPQPADDGRQPTGVHRQRAHADGERGQGEPGPLLVGDLQRAGRHDNRSTAGPAINGGMEVDRMYIYRTINWLAAAIHTADPSARVTSGAWTFQVSSTRNFSGGGHFYSNSSLMAAGGKANGTMDFYEVHYYGANGAQFSPFLDGRNPDVLGADRQAAGDGRILRARHRRGREEQPLHAALRQRLQRRLGLAIHGRRPAGRLAVDAGSDAGGLQRAHDRSRQLPLAALMPTPATSRG